MKALVGALNQEKVLVGAFSVIVKTEGWFAALAIMLPFWGVQHRSAATPAARSGAERENGVSIKSPIPIYCDALQNRTSSDPATAMMLLNSVLLLNNSQFPSI